MIYTVILNSNSKVAGSTTTNAVYNYDWSYLPNDKKYTLRWTFVSNTTTQNAFPTIPTLSIELGQTTVFATASSTTSTTSSIVGVMIPYTIGASSFLFADTELNSPIYLHHKPTNNSFNVNILNNSNPPTNWVDSATVAITDYVLTLSFTEVM